MGKVQQSKLTYRRYPLRKGRTCPRILIDYYHVTNSTLSRASARTTKARRAALKIWSSSIVRYWRNKGASIEYVESVYQRGKDEVKTEKNAGLSPEELTKQMKEQLEILKTGKRSVSLIQESDQERQEQQPQQQTCVKPAGLIKVEPADSEPKIGPSEQALHEEKPTASTVRNGEDEEALKGESKPTIDKQADTARLPPEVLEKSEIKMEVSPPIKIESHAGEVKPKSNFLDMLMNKAKVDMPKREPKCGSAEKAKDSKTAITQFMKKSHEVEPSTDSCDEFLGFEEGDRVPGMLLTPQVPKTAQNQAQNPAFVSESLNEFLRENMPDINELSVSEEVDAKVPLKVLPKVNADGLVTPETPPPPMCMPVLPESLQKLRTVAERKTYLQRFARHHKLAIINNEATIYRELQRKANQRHHKKNVAQQLMQAAHTLQPFTRNGWMGATYVATEYDKYYYQTIEVDDVDGVLTVKLPGVMGNNATGSKRRHRNFVSADEDLPTCGNAHCVDMDTWRSFRIIQPRNDKTKILHQPTLRTAPKPCPLSFKPFQKPHDEDAAALLLAGGSMAVVRMPSVDLEVFPELGKPLDEIAQRYLQYILPHHDISREWAEFSVSTLQNPSSSKLPAKTTDLQQIHRRKSFIFAIPYANDRTHILVRRVVDRSEKLDDSFKFENNDASMRDLSFAANLDESDELLMECANIVSELINTVAISCSENSFIKDDCDTTYEDGKRSLNRSDDDQRKRALDKAGVLKGNNSSGTGTGIGSNNNKKNSRLILELKRLNATVIDAVAAKSPTKNATPCPKEFCSLGCICKSLNQEFPLRRHCGKAQCMFECTCKGLNTSRIMRLETDGHSISTEDAFMLRRKATERLARMEKEFTSTVVLTGNETLLINESQTDKKRRCTKAPKRYDDFTDNEEEKPRTSPNKSSSVLAIDRSHESSLLIGNLNEPATEVKEPIYVESSVVDALKHCRVSVRRFEDIKNMAVWCMVHQLYNCFCGGDDVEGKSLFADKEEPLPKVSPKPVASTVEPNRGSDVRKVKTKYKFDQAETSVEDAHTATGRILRSVSRTKRLAEDDTDNTDYESDMNSINGAQTDDSSIASSVTSRRRRIHLRHDVPAAKAPKIIISTPQQMPEAKAKEYISNSSDCCRRVLSLPRKYYWERNRKRVAKVVEFIRKTETSKTRALLDEHILRSIYFNKQKTKMARALNHTETPIIELSDDESPHTETFETTNDTQNASGSGEESLLMPIRSIEAPIDMLCIPMPVVKRGRPAKLRPQPTAGQKAEKEGSKTPICNSVRAKLELEQCQHLSLQQQLLQQEQEQEQAQQEQEQDQQQAQSDLQEEEPQQQQQYYQEATFTSETPAVGDGSFPKITECFSLNGGTSSEVFEMGTEQAHMPRDPLEESAAAGGDGLKIGDISVSNEQFKDFYNGVVNHMNNLVSKKMQDIDIALKRESKLIPPPNEEILCIIRWTNFLDAFKEGFVYIWAVKMKTVTFLAATINNVMPVIIGALGVVSLAAFESSTKLPLMSRMLLRGFRNEKTRNLAIVMQGRATYWRIKGFLRSDGNSACVKPTPQTHPILTKKINLLCSLLIKQRIKDYQNRLQQRLGMRQPLAMAMSHPNSSNLPQLAPFLNVHQQMQASNVANTQAAADKLTTSNSMAPTTSRAEEASTEGSIGKGNVQLLSNLKAQNDYNAMKTNIEFRHVTPDDASDIQQPEVLSYDHRWLVVDLYNDFSHIFVPAFGDLVSLDRIHRVMAFSRLKKKIVKLQFFKNAPFDAYVTPTSKRKIYFGPLKFNTRPPILILLQSVDGVMMLREVYQRKHNIRVNPKESTKAFWVLQLKGQLHFELDDEDLSNYASESKSSTSIKMEPSTESESDDDCYIVDDKANERHQHEQGQELEQEQDQEEEQKQSMCQERINFTIQTTQDQNKIQLTPIIPATSINGSVMPSLALPTQSGFVPIFNIPQSAVITSVAPASQELPYSSTVYISNSNGMPAHLSNSMAMRSPGAVLQVQSVDDTIITSSPSVTQATRNLGVMSSQIQVTSLHPNPISAPLAGESGLARLKLSARSPSKSQMAIKAPNAVAKRRNSVFPNLSQSSGGEAIAPLKQRRQSLLRPTSHSDISMKLQKLTSKNPKQKASNSDKSKSDGGLEVFNATASAESPAGEGSTTTIGCTVITKLSENGVQNAIGSVDSATTDDSAQTSSEIKGTGNSAERKIEPVKKAAAATKKSTGESSLLPAGALKRTASGVLKPPTTVQVFKPGTSSAVATKLAIGSLSTTSNSKNANRTYTARPLFVGKPQSCSSPQININNRSFLLKVKSPEEVKSTLEGMHNKSMDSGASTSGVGVRVPPIKFKRISLPTTSLAGNLKAVGVMPRSRVPPKTTTVTATATIATTTTTTSTSVSQSDSGSGIMSAVASTAKGGRTVSSPQKVTLKPRVSTSIIYSTNSKDLSTPAVTTKRVVMSASKALMSGSGSISTKVNQMAESQRDGEDQNTQTRTITLAQATKGGIINPDLLKRAVSGFFYTKWLALPRFAARRIGDDYLLKIPGARGLLLKGEKRVNYYLNQYLMKKSNTFGDKLPAEWKFVLQSNLNSQMNKMTVRTVSVATPIADTNEKKNIQRKIIIKRKIPAPSNDNDTEPQSDLTTVNVTKADKPVQDSSTTASIAVGQNCEINDAVIVSASSTDV